MDRNMRRSNAPAWPPNRYSAYQRMSSNEDFNSNLTPGLSTPGTGSSGVYRSLLTPRIDPSPYDSPALLLQQSTPKADKSAGVDVLRYDSEKQRKTWFGYGWRGGAKIAFFSATLALVANVIIMIYMSVSFQYMDGFPVVYRGTCEVVERQNSIWHFVINGLSTVLLASSNYAMQLLSAPTRNNIDRAHSTGHWLDVGIPSIRNLRFLHWKRRGLWFALAISSIPLHLIYNSTFYAAIATNNYNVLYATLEFVTGSPYDTSQFPDSPAQNISSFQRTAVNWTRLDNEACINNYAHDFVTTYRNIITVVKNSSTTSSLLEVVINELPASGSLGATYDSFAWICNDTLTTNKTGVTRRNDAGFVPCASQANALAKISDTWWRSGGYSIDHCLAENAKPDCHLHFAPQFMGPVILMNIVKCLVLFYVTFRLTDKPLVTPGDAIESFITHPDPTTSGRCLTSARDAERTFIRGAGTVPAPIPQPFVRIRHRWGTVVSRRQWLTLVFLFTIMLGGIVIGLAFGVRALAPPTLANAWSIGLGIVQTQNLVLGANMPQLGASAVLITALVANAPQALLSFLYMVYNVIFTSMYLGEDWDMYGAYSRTSLLTRHKGTHRHLRVSDPRGQQKSTHMLNLPFRYAVPLVAMSGLLHWLMSQSLYLANISIIPRDGTLPRHDEITTIAYAPQALIWLGSVAVVMLIVIVTVALRRFGGEMQIVGSNSAAISAACHSDHLSEKRRREIVLRKIAWGELPSSGDARLPDFASAGHPTKRTTLARGQEVEMTLGLGIDNGARSKITADDFSSLEERNDVESNGYEAVRGLTDDYDSTGFARSTGVGHCGFSDTYVFRPEPGRLYA